MGALFTIGHSTHEWEALRDLLLQHQIEAVADVRSSPFSGRLPQFNRDILEKNLARAGLKYAFLGDELGARRSERECYVEGVARYERIAKTASFKAGLLRLQKGMERLRIALLCAEKDPLECHRTILVCRELARRAEIQHILADGSLESHPDAEKRLMAEERIPADDLFMNQDDLLARAYESRGSKIAYTESAEAGAPV